MKLSTRWAYIALIATMVGFSALTAQSRSLHNQELRNLPSLASALSSYLVIPEPSLTYTTPATQESKGVRILKSTLTSLTWRSKSEVNRTPWQHELIVAVPNDRLTNKAILVVSGGSNKNELFELLGKNKRDSLLASQRRLGAEDLIKEIAQEIKAVVAVLNQVPNQPLIFGKDNKPRVEDDLIAYSWARYLETKDPTWLAQFPMVKSTLTALTISEEMVQRQAGFAIDGWMLTGASKRGWTVWLAAAMDRRVIGVAPIVIDLLNLIPSMQHHYASYGFWAEAIKDYVHHGIMTQISTPAVKELASLIDPYEFRDQLTMPKLIINAANDEFFLPDSSLFYYPELPGPKHLLYVPNSGHHINNPELIYTLTSFFRSLHDPSYRVPTLSWRFEQGVLEITTDTTPLSATLWEAVNPENRDFRFSSKKPYPTYQPTSINLTAQQSEHLPITPPSKGWKSFFVEVEYAGPADKPHQTLKQSSSVYVIKDSR